MKKTFLAFALALSICSQAAAADTLGAFQKRIELKDVELVPNESYAVRLLTRRAKGEHLDAEVQLIVTGAATGSSLLFDLVDVAGFDPKITPLPLVSRDRKELFLSMYSGGSGGYSSYYVIAFDGRAARYVYNSDSDPFPSRVNGLFMDGYKCRVWISGTDIDTVIDLSPRKERYRQEGVYDASGKLLKQVEVWGGSYAAMEAADVDGDGIFELQGTVYYSGEYHADTIFTVTFTQSLQPGREETVRFAIDPSDDLK